MLSAPPDARRRDTIVVARLDGGRGVYINRRHVDRPSGLSPVLRYCMHATSCEYMSERGGFLVSTRAPCLCITDNNNDDDSDNDDDDDMTAESLVDIYLSREDFPVERTLSENSYVNVSSSISSIRFYQTFFECLFI